MNSELGENWCKIEIYNEYLKKIAALLVQLHTVEKMQHKAETELSMLEAQAETHSKTLYRERLVSKLQQCGERQKDLREELSLIQKLKEQLEETLPVLKSHS